MDKNKFDKLKDFVVAILALEGKEDDEYAKLLTVELYNSFIFD